MKKNFKLVLALAIAAIMIAGSISAIAAPTAVTINAPASPSELTTDATSYDATLTIGGLQKDDVVNLYQVLRWVGNDVTATVRYGGWAPVAPFNTVLTDVPSLRAFLDDDTIAPGSAVPYLKAELAGQLARAVTTTTKAATATVENGETSVVFNVNGNPGMYMALIVPADQDMVYNPVFVSSDYNTTNPSASWTINESATYSDSAAAKKSTVTLDKQAAVSEADYAEDTAGAIAAAGSVAPASGTLDWTTTAIGETVNFTVKTTIPAFGKVYSNPYFQLTDKLTDLKLVANSVRITDPALTSGDATIHENDDLSGYNIVFDADYLKTLAVPTEVTVTYSALVTDAAPYNVNVERNEVSTVFSHDPSNESDYKFKKDTTQHYTFSIDAESIFWYENETKIGHSGSEILKVGTDPEGKPITTSSSWSSIEDGTKEEIKGPLAGAVFGLYTDEACNTAYIPKDSAGADKAALTVTSGADGRMTITGLDAGKYYLKEITAPAGYVKSNEVIPIEITTVVEKVNVTEWTTDGINWAPTSSTGAKSYTYETEVLKEYSIKVGNGATTTHRFTNFDNKPEISWVESSSTEIPTSIPNVKGVELPSTGGIGTTIFYVGGSLMVLAAAILLITKRRMGAEE